MTSQQDIPLYGEVVNGFDSRINDLTPETADLRKTRQSAFEKFRESGFPTIRNEDWKYTNLTRFLKDEYTLEAPAAVPAAELVASARIPDFDCYTLVLVNGVWGGMGELPKGVEVLSVAEAIK